MATVLSIPNLDGNDIRPLKQGYKDLLSAGFEKAKQE
jgi:hypothetical protein